VQVAGCHVSVFRSDSELHCEQHARAKLALAGRPQPQQVSLLCLSSHRTPQWHKR
jgi:hypothetical protein